MKTLIVMGGLTGVGKSFAAKRLSERLENALYFDSDMFAKRFIEQHNIMFTKLPPSEQLNVRLQIHQAKLDKIALDFNDYDFIVLDTCFDLPQSRQMFYQFAASLGINLQVIEVVCPEPIVKQRIFDNPHEEHRMIGDQDSRWRTYTRMKNSWVHITKPHTVIESDEDIKSQLNEFIKLKLS